MRREFMALEASMREFIDQGDYPTMIMNSSDNDILFPARILQNIERQSESDIFLIFPFACDAVGDYVQKCMELLGAQVESVNEGRTSGEQEPWPPLPLACLDPRQAPEARLRLAIDYAREVLPEDTRIIWGLMPPMVTDPEGYRRLIRPLLALGGFQDWMTGHRFFIRDDLDAPFLVPDLERDRVDGVLVLDLDFSPERVADRLVQTANDEDAPTPERMDAVYHLAAFDLAYQRYDLANDKYDLLHSYHLDRKDPVGQAAALGGAGDVALRTGDYRLAKERYQQALAVAVPTESLGILLNLFLGAGEACLRLQQYDESEGYFDHANHTAGKMLNPFCKADVMEKLGEARVGGGKIQEAAEIWNAARGICRQVSYRERWSSILDQLIPLCEAQGMVREAMECRAERGSLDQEG